MKKHFIMSLCLMAMLISFSSCKQTVKEQPKYITDVQAHRGGMKVVTWTVDNKEDMVKMIEAGADAIISNYPDRLLEVVKQYEN